MRQAGASHARTRHYDLLSAPVQTGRDICG
ncbi:hypothetical protein SAMN05428963_11248 [Consotaella salsifontis]|uniref:Uncharacterized protein n=1 Tax=Consotaella salsifontis TaxID=1365950 RepID=A0A1T4SMU3_9HYPH|nr:hypothetical protein SAMN05428963_11248 [Consotaella salsifontis]